MDDAKKGGKLWQSDWKSPVSLGIFIAGAGIGFALVVFTILNLWVTNEQIKAQSSSAMSSQEMQQLEQGAATSPATGAGTSGSAAAQ